MARVVKKFSGTLSVLQGSVLRREAKADPQTPSIYRYGKTVPVYPQQKQVGEAVQTVFGERSVL